MLKCFGRMLKYKHQIIQNSKKHSLFKEIIYVNAFQFIQTKASVNDVESAGGCGVPQSKVQKHLSTRPMGQTTQRWTEGAPESVDGLRSVI